MKKRLSALLMIAVMVVSMIANATSINLPELPIFTQITVDDGLPSNGITSVVQDKKGYLWFGTSDGLARYDGIGFKIWRYQPGLVGGLPANNVEVMAIDSKDRLWMGIRGNGLVMLDADRKTIVEYSSKTDKRFGDYDVFSVLVDKDDTVWVGTYGGGIYRLTVDGQVTRYLNDDNGENSSKDKFILNSTLAPDRKTPWFVTLDGLVKFENDDFIRVDLPEGTSASIYLIKFFKNEDLLIGSIGSNDPLWLKNNGEFEKFIGVEKKQNVSRIIVAHEENNGARWFGVDSTLQYQNDKSDKLSIVIDQKNRISAIHQDRDGIVWITTMGSGIYRLPPEWRNFTSLSDLLNAKRGSTQSVVVSAVAQGTDGLWFSDTAGGINYLNLYDKEIKFFDAKSLGLPEGQATIYRILRRDNNSLWVSTKNNNHILEAIPSGVISKSVNSKIIKTLNTKDQDASLSSKVVRTLVDNDDNLWTLFLSGELEVRNFAGDVINTITKGDDKGLLVEDTNQIILGPDRAVWIAGTQGLLRWTGDRFAPVEGTTSGLIFSMTIAANNQLWVHKLDKLELYYWNGNSLMLRQHFNAGENGLPAVESNGLIAAENGDLWIMTLRGLYRYDVASDLFKHYSKNEGFPTNDFNVIGQSIMLDNGIISVSTGSDVILFDPSRLKKKSTAPVVVFDEKSLRRGEDIFNFEDAATDVLPGDRDLLISARVLSYVDVASHRFRFRLKGYDPDWVDVDASGVRTFSQLEPGNYQLEVIGATADGVWSDPQKIAIIVIPPWWRKPWAYALYVLAAIAMSFLLGAMYRRRIKRRNALEKERYQRELAIQASEAKTRFLATLGHEIRTPMTGVLGMTELLQKTALDTRQTDYVSSLRRAGEHLLRLVNDALDLARIETGKLPLLDGSFSPADLINEITDLIRPSAQNKGLRFEVSIAPDLPAFLHGDAGRVRQILLNLVNNALKFTERGKVSISAESLQNSTGLRVRVRDTGPGISAEQQNRLFRRFEQAEGERTAARYGGSGLGLAISRELAQAMGGQIDIESQVGDGTCFIVELPLALATRADSSSAIQTEPITYQHGPLQILLIEDDQTIADVIRELLNVYGHQVQHVPQALAALTELVNQHFDMAIVDLDLPGIDGCELARMIRSQGNTIPLLALTARADAEAEADTVAAGMNAFQRKPVTGVMLAAAIERTMETRLPTIN